ncbi:MAG: GNAT family N-acetyltransferase [Actinobacteria bacterium]|nr:GNAT family N-acetyltransferase [Actinomycetota bacterium]
MRMNGEHGPSLRRRSGAAVNALLKRAGLRMVPVDALELRLTSAVAGRDLPFPAGGVSDDAVLLRQLNSADVDLISRFTDDSPAAWLSMQGALHAAGLALDLAVVDRASGSAAGLIQLQRFDWPNHRASIGLWLLPEARGRGLMTHALTLLVGWTFSEGILDRIEYLAQTDNERSIRLAERCGFKQEGELRSCLVMGRCRHDAVLLAALRDDWRPCIDGRAADGTEPRD